MTDLSIEDEKDAVKTNQALWDVVVNNRALRTAPAPGGFLTLRK